MIEYVTCTDLAVEDELHFLCVCDFYNDLRHNLYQAVAAKCPLFFNQTDEEKFIYIMSEESKLVAKYICEAWCRRREQLYRGVI